jgi:short-chain fatty acids transporter
MIVCSILSWCNWAVGLVMSVFLARYIAMSHDRVDFKILAACAYISTGAIGMFGPSGPEVLIIATPGNFMEKTLGGLFPYSTTIFSPTVLTAEILAFLVILPLFIYLIHPAYEDTPLLPEAIKNKFEEEDREALESLKNAKSKKDMTFAERLDNNTLVNYIIGIAGIIYAVDFFAKNGFNMSLDLMNFIILMIGIILHKTPNNLSNAFKQGVTNGYAVALQFPIYAGIQGMMGSSGLVLLIATAFANMSTPETFIHFDYIAGAILNLFVPSSGGLFMVAGPALGSAGTMLGVPGNQSFIAFTAGEAISNVIQPFWAIPILGIAGLKMKDIMGTCIFSFIILSVVVNIVYGVMW